MKAAPISTLAAPEQLKHFAQDASVSQKDKTAEAARQFEAVLVRQFLGESLKGLIKDGTSSQVYGYLVTDKLAESVTRAGGLGISNLLQAQLTPKGANHAGTP